VKGNVIDMALLRSVPHPGAALIGKADRDDGGAAVSDGKVYGDLGRHVFRYAVRPHAGDADAAVLTKEARAFNTPLRVVSGAGLGGAVNAGVALGSAAIEVVAVKPAEDGRGWVWRLVNVTDAPVTTAWPAGDGGGWTECDLRENVLVEQPAGAELTFGAFEIKTLRVGF